MMMVKSMKWGYDGGGMACGPVPGSDVVELEVQTDAGTIYVVASRMMEFEKVQVIGRSIFDWLMDIPGMRNDEYDAGRAQIEEDAFEEYDYELSEADESMTDSALYPAIRLALYAMSVRCNTGFNEEELPAEKFIADWLGKELENCEIPEPDNSAYEEDEWEEDEWEEDD